MGRRCACLPQLEGDVTWEELTPASLIIKRTIKKLIMFGKSLVIYSRRAHYLDSFKQVSELRVGVTALQPRVKHPKMSGLGQN